MYVQITYKTKSGKVYRSTAEIPSSIASVKPVDEQYRRVEEYIVNEYDVDIDELLDVERI